MTTAISAPGKVLLAGGYLVLDPKYTALVFGLSARIHVLVKDVVGDRKGVAEIGVESPQFLQAQWQYEYKTAGGEGGGVEVKQLEG